MIKVCCIFYDRIYNTIPDNSPYEKCGFKEENMMILFLLNYQILGNGLDCLQYLRPLDAGKSPQCENRPRDYWRMGSYKNYRNSGTGTS